MKKSTLLVLFCIGLFIYSIYGIDKRYQKYKSDTNNILNFKILSGKVAGIILSFILLGMHLLDLIPYND